MHGDQPGGPIRWRMHIPVAPERVYDALASDDGRASFWAESAKEHNGEIEFVFVNGYRHKARILERQRPTRFVLEYFGNVASFKLAASDRGGTDLYLVHEGVNNQEWNEVHAGWLNVLFPLKAAVGFGVDLRNHDQKRCWEHGYADQ
jgi:uncharacterized protein YndB with AHSA1/START domain